MGEEMLGAINSICEVQTFCEISNNQKSKNLVL